MDFSDDIHTKARNQLAGFALAAIGTRIASPAGESERSGTLSTPHQTITKLIVVRKNDLSAGTTIQLLKGDGHGGLFKSSTKEG